MTRIYLETGKKSTFEYVFMRTLLGSMGYGSGKVEILCADGKDNLHNLANKMRETVLEGKGRNLIVFDADTEANGGGFQKRKGEIERQLAAMGVEADLFLFPNNADDGDFETLLEKLIQAGEHKLFLDCYGDYERCLGDRYFAPNRKGRLHTYISAQKGLTQAQRKNLGKGEWLFDDSRFWNLESGALDALKRFLAEKL